MSRLDGKYQWRTAMSGEGIYGHECDVFLWNGEEHSTITRATQKEVTAYEAENGPRHGALGLLQGTVDGPKVIAAGTYIVTVKATGAVHAMTRTCFIRDIAKTDGEPA